MSFANPEDDNDNMDLGFDVADVKPAKFDLLPDGIYDAIVSKVSVAPTKDGTGRRLNVELTIETEGYVGRKIFDGINVINVNPKAQDIGQQTASALFAACGIGGRNASALGGASCRIKLRTQAESDSYEARNIVRGYLARGGAVAAPPSTTKPAAAAPAAPGEPPKRKPPSFAGPK